MGKRKEAKGKRRRRNCKNGEMIVRCVSINDIDGTGSAANSGEGGLVTLVTIVTLVLGRSQELQASTFGGGLAGFFGLFHFSILCFFCLEIGEQANLFLGPQVLILPFFPFLFPARKLIKSQAFWIGCAILFLFFFFLFFFSHILRRAIPETGETTQTSIPIPWLK